MRAILLAPNEEVRGTKVLQHDTADMFVVCLCGGKAENKRITRSFHQHNNCISSRFIVRSAEWHPSLESLKHTRLLTTTSACYHQHSDAHNKLELLSFLGGHRFFILKNSNAFLVSCDVFCLVTLKSLLSRPTSGKISKLCVQPFDT